MLRYYKLFDLLNRRGMKKSDLRSILSSSTVAKLSKGEYISGEALDKICLFLKCQPGDIMEVVHCETNNENSNITYSTNNLDETYMPDAEFTVEVTRTRTADSNTIIDAKYIDCEIIEEEL